LAAEAGSVEKTFRFFGSTICIAREAGIACSCIGVCVVGLEPRGYWVAARFAFSRARTVRNDAVIVCAGGELPTPLLQKAGIRFDTKFGTA